MYLGINQVLLGTVLWLLCFRMMPGAAAANLEKVWSQIHDHYSANPVASHFSNLNLSSFTDAKKKTFHV